MQGYGIVLVTLGGGGEFVGDFRLRSAEDDSRPALAFRLGLSAHGVLQPFGDDDISNLY